MESRWSDAKAAEYIERYGPKWGEDLALRTYLGALIGMEDRLVLHGGGNNSVKTSLTNILGEHRSIIFVKASGANMAAIEPEGYTALDLEYLKKLRALPEISDEEMRSEFQTHMCHARAAAPSIETLVHAFIPKKFIDHTHADAILTLTNQPDGMKLVREALGPEVLILDYITPGFKLAQAAATAFENSPQSKAMVWMRHGLISWGDTARESYEATISVIQRAEDYAARRARRPLIVQVETPIEVAEKRYAEIAPSVRGSLALPTGDADQPYARTILQPLITREALNFVDSDRGREFALSPSLTADHLIRTKALPLWIDKPDYGDIAKLRGQVASAIRDYAAAYDAYIERHISRMPKGVARLDSLPRVILMPGIGAVCSGKDVGAAGIVRDIAAHTLAVKAQIAAMGEYSGMSESDLFAMEYRPLQHAKLGIGPGTPAGSPCGAGDRCGGRDRIRHLPGASGAGLPRGSHRPAGREPEFADPGAEGPLRAPHPGSASGCDRPGFGRAGICGRQQHVGRSGSRGGECRRGARILARGNESGSLSKAGEGQHGGDSPDPGCSRTPFPYPGHGR